MLELGRSSPPWGGILPLLLLSKQASSYHLAYSNDQSVPLREFLYLGLDPLYNRALPHRVYGPSEAKLAALIGLAY